MRGGKALNARNHVASSARQQKQRCVAPRAAIAEPPALNNNARSSNGAAKPLTKEGPTIMNGQVTSVGVHPVALKSFLAYAGVFFNKVVWDRGSGEYR